MHTSAVDDHWWGDGVVAPHLVIHEVVQLFIVHEKRGNPFGFLGRGRLLSSVISNLTRLDAIAHRTGADLIPVCAPHWSLRTSLVIRSWS